MDCSSCLSFGQACFLLTFGSTPLANGGNLSKAQLKRLPKRLRALAQPKSPFDETLLGLTIFLLSFPRARTPSNCEGDRKAFGYPGNLRYESIAAGVRPLRKALAYLRAIGTFQRIHRSTRSGRGRSNSGPGVCF